MKQNKTLSTVIAKTCLITRDPVKQVQTMKAHQSTGVSWASANYKRSASWMKGTFEALSVQ